MMDTHPAVTRFVVVRVKKVTGQKTIITTHEEIAEGDEYELYRGDCFGSSGYALQRIRTRLKADELLDMGKYSYYVQNVEFADGELSRDAWSAVDDVTF